MNLGLLAKIRIDYETRLRISHFVQVEYFVMESYILLFFCEVKSCLFLNEEFVADLR
jgi:hypothetical protein